MTRWQAAAEWRDELAPENMAVFKHSSRLKREERKNPGFRKHFSAEGFTESDIKVKAKHIRQKEQHR